MIFRICISEIAFSPPKSGNAARARSGGREGVEVPRRSKNESRAKAILQSSENGECHWCQALLPPLMLYLFPTRTRSGSENKAGSCFPVWPLTFFHERKAR